MHFSKTKDGDGAFVIKKNDLIFETKTFYEYFFKDLAEKPQYTVIDLLKKEPDYKLTGQVKHVFTTVAQVLNKTCDGINDDWFNEEKSQDADTPNSNASEVSASEDPAGPTGKPRNHNDSAASVFRPGDNRVTWTAL